MKKILVYSIIFLLIGIFPKIVRGENIKSEYDLFLKESITINLNKKILDENIYYDDNIIEIQNNNNHLIITGKKNGETNLVIKENNIEIIKTKIVVNGIKLLVKIYDKDNNDKTKIGDATLENAIYEILDSNKNYVATIKTNENGYAESENILEKNTFYYLKEIKASKGYKENNSYKSFYTGTYLQTRINIYSELIKSNIHLERSNIGIISTEPFLMFNIYHKKTNNLYKRNIIMNSNGVLDFTLPYGVWIIEHVYTSSNKRKLPNIEINVPNEQDIKKIINDEGSGNKIKINFINAKTNKIIKNTKIKIKLKDTIQNKYICNKNNDCIYESSDGYVVVDNLPYSNYQIEEIKTNENYYYNESPLEIKIDKNTFFNDDNILGKILNINYYKEEISGNVKINSIGENDFLTKQNIEFKYIPLNFSHYKIYAKENIYDNETNLIHKKDELIKTINSYENNTLINNLYIGKYYIKQVSTDINHNINNNTFDFEINKNNEYKAIVNIKNNLKKGSIEIIKKDKLSNIPLQNHLYELHIENGNKDIFINKYYTDISGKINIFNIPIKYGYKYYLKEIKNDINYEIDYEKYYFNFNNEQHININFYSNIIKGKIELIVLNKTTNKKISNILIKLIKDKKIISEKYSDNNGQIIFDNLLVGKYKIDGLDKEIIINDKKLYQKMILYKTILTSKQETNLVVVDKTTSKNLLNENIQINNVPNTSKNKKIDINNYNHLILIIILFCLKKELSYVIIDKKRGI